MSMPDQQSEPLNRILKAPLAMIRIAALVLALLAMILPAVSMSALGAEVSVNIVQLAGWLLLFPILLVAALVSPAVPALVPYTRLLDIAAAVFGVIASLYLLFNMNTPFGPLGGEMGAGLGLGGWALFLATIAAIVVVLPASVVDRVIKLRR